MAVAPPPHWGYHLPADGGSGKGSKERHGGTKVVEAEHRDNPMTTTTAEHQKTVTTANGPEKLSSPFGFTGGEGSTGAAAASYAGPSVHIVSEPPYVDGFVTGPQVVSVSVGASCQQFASQQFASQQLAGVSCQQFASQQFTSQQFTGPAPAPTGPMLEGWLAKRGKEFGKSWNLRWFVLHPGGILTYSHSKGGKEDKRILLCPATQVRALTHPESTAEAKAHSSKKPFAFEIFQGPGVRTWYLDGGSAEKLDVWLRCFSEAIGQVRMSAVSGMPRVA